MASPQLLDELRVNFKRFPIDPPARLRGSSGRSVLAKLARAALAAVIIGLLQSPVAVAVPIAEWGGQWTAFFESSRSGRATNVIAFGQQATRNGQITDRGFPFEPLPGTPAWAKSGTTASVSRNILGSDAIGNAVADFDRTFRLKDSPAGWDVSLLGLLVGRLDVSNRRLDPEAIVGVSARIFSAASQPLIPLLEFSFNQRVFAPIPRIINVNRVLAKHAVLEDGIYSVHGSLGTFATVNTSLFRDGGAFSDFFPTSSRDSGDGFRLFVTAQPVPEHTPLLLFGTTMAGLLVAARWRPRQQASKSGASANFLSDSAEHWHRLCTSIPPPSLLKGK